MMTQLKNNMQHYVEKNQTTHTDYILNTKNDVPQKSNTRSKQVGKKRKKKYIY